MEKRLGFAATSASDGMEGVLNFAGSYNFSWVELSLNLPEFFPEAMPLGEWARYGARAAEMGVGLSAHAPEDISLIHLHEPVRRAGLGRLKEIMDWSHSSGVSRLTVHIGTSVYFTLPQGRQYLHQVYPERFMKILSESLRELRDYAVGKVQLCVENVHYFGPRVVQEVLSDMLPQGGMYLTWDWGHSFGDLDHESFMRAHRCYVRNCHVHDHDGRRDHLVVGDGCMNFPSYIEAVRDIHCPLIFEVRPREQAVVARDRFLAVGYHLSDK